MGSALGLALLVGAGGFVGSLLRYGVSLAFYRAFPLAAFPAGTLVVNLVGCFAIGLLLGVGDTRHVFAPETRVFAGVGLLGGFTTFSTFGYETFAMARDGDVSSAALNLAGHVVLGLACVWAGYALGVGSAGAPTS